MMFGFYSSDYPVREALGDISFHRVPDKGVQRLELSRGFGTDAARKNVFLILHAQPSPPGDILLDQIAGTQQITQSTFSPSRISLKICFPRKTRDLMVPTGQLSIWAISSSESSSK